MIRKPALAVEEVARPRAPRSRVPDPKAAPKADSKASASQNRLRRPARTGRAKNCVERKNKKQRQTPLRYQPEDDITLLQICVNLKDVFAWGKVPLFWIMVQDTFQIKTGKPYKGVGRHVDILVRRRRAEQQEIKEWGKISISRVGAGCRPLLDKWIAGANQLDHDSPDISIASSLTTLSTLSEDDDDLNLGEEGKQQLDSDDAALEVQKRSATDAWLDTSCDTSRCKKLKHYTPEPTSSTIKSRVGSLGCWSLSGTSVTSDSSFEDESEDEGEDDVKGGVLYPTID